MCVYVFGKNILLTVDCGFIKKIEVSSRESGCLLIVKNYTGDVINFGLAAEMARANDGIPVEMVVVADDCALLDMHGTDRDQMQEQLAQARGIAGTVFVHKLAGYAAESGQSLEKVAELARWTAKHVKTIGVSLTPCVVPGNTESAFDLQDNEMEIGLGIHGEAGSKRSEITTANDVVDMLIKDYIFKANETLTGLQSCVLLVNNLGAMTNLELYIVANRAIAVLEDTYGISIERVFVSAMMTSLEMSGVSLSILPLPEENSELRQSILDGLDMPTTCIANFSCTARKENSDHNRSNDEFCFLESSSGAAARSERRAGLQSEMNEQEQAEVSRIASIIREVCKAAIDHREEFNKLDSAVGDGDMGNSFATGAHNVLSALDEMSDTASISQVFLKVGFAMQSTGGSSGPFVSAFLLRVGKVLADSPLSRESFKRAISEGVQAIQKLGGAKLGERTMIDVLHPVATALEEGLSLSDLSIVAEKAAESTKHMFPKRGRSRYLREQAIGHVDPGAFAMKVFINSVIDALSKE